MLENNKWRLKFHLMPPEGWLNDPNGLCQFRGEYHVFFQHTPGNPEGGDKYWGHYTSSDLIHWNYAGDKLAPVDDVDINGVYSGSALIWNDKMYLYYTGNVKEKSKDPTIPFVRRSNTVLVSSEDGIHFGEKQCLMTREDYPADISGDVRDPKVMTGGEIGIEDGAFYMLLGARSQADVGEAMLYRSENLTDWELASRITTAEKFGYMWECPDAFMKEGLKFLSVSPQGVEREGLNYQNIYQSGYFPLAGSFDGDYTLGDFQEWDKGFDFYAPQTFQDEKGRRILIGWIGMPDAPQHKNPTVELGWQHALTVPREITYINGRLYQNPVAEMETLRGKKNELSMGKTSKPMEAFDMEVQVEKNADLQLILSDGLTISYDRERKIFSLRFEEDKNMGQGRIERSAYVEQLDHVRLLVDTSCLELYLNHGETVFTTRFYTQDARNYIQLKKGVEKAEYWEMTSFVVDKNISL